MKNEEQAKEIALLKEVNKNIEKTLHEDKKSAELRNTKVKDMKIDLHF
jgi:hypothetical protein